MRYKLQQKSSKIKNIILFFVITIILLFFTTEYDRNFSGNERNPMYFYYIQVFPLPVLGLYNTFIRLTNPHHTHIFNVKDFDSNQILQSNWKIIKK